MRVGITGYQGFVGSNLRAHLSYREDISMVYIDKGEDSHTLASKLKDVDVLVHLAGVNRSIDQESFHTSNVDFTRQVIDILESRRLPYTMIYSSSTQAILDNPYGVSKRGAEDLMKDRIKNGKGIIFRLPGIFGKWSRPNYNSVVATFCYNVARDISLEVHDPNKQLTLVYIDDVINHITTSFETKSDKERVSFMKVQPEYNVELGNLAKLIQGFKAQRLQLYLPTLSDLFVKHLYTTWLSFLPNDNFSYKPLTRTDDRGYLFELIKGANFGQIFISKTHPGITRGNHFHHSKVEKFLVIHGTGVIRFRNFFSDDVIDYPVSGNIPEIVDIPPGLIHSITNTGEDEMITLFWANEVFDQHRPDTYAAHVDPNK